MNLADEMFVLLTQDISYQKSDIHTAAYYGETMEMTYHDGMVQITHTSFSLSGGGGSKKEFRCTKDSFAQWIQEQSARQRRAFEDWVMEEKKNSLLSKKK